jgi:hypothetical protein
MTTFIQETGNRYGRLLVLRRAADHVFPSGRVGVTWICLCDCGKESISLARNLRSGSTRSCGCLAAEHSRTLTRTHGMSGTPEYRAWKGAIGRCENRSSPHYQDYGGRGIMVCEQWRHNFEAFFTDVGPRPSPDHSLDRIDNDGNYEPGNCRWATKTEQSSNRRKIPGRRVRGRVHRTGALSWSAIKQAIAERKQRQEDRKGT